jgi:hypothetical protein
MHQKVKILRLKCFRALRKVQNEAIPKVFSKGHAEEWKALDLIFKAANVPKCAQRSQESMLGLGGTKGDGAGKRVMKCHISNVRCAQKMTGRGMAGKGSRGEGCRGAEHGQTCHT